MEIKILGEGEKEYYGNDILNLLVESDNEFVPPLSKRGTPKDKSFSLDRDTSDGILSYYKSMCREQILAAISDGKVIGFVSFWENFEDGETPNIYVSTLVVAQKQRGKGLALKMYGNLFDVLYSDRAVYTRTWSTNAAHTGILSRLGFSEFKRIKDHRGIGIDTVYYERKSAKNS